MKVLVTGSNGFIGRHMVKALKANNHEVLSFDIDKSEEQLEEYIFLGLRKMSGINVFDIKHKFDIDFDEKYKGIIEKYINTGHLKKTMNGYCLTLNGVLLSNIIMADFLEV